MLLLAAGMAELMLMLFHLRYLVYLQRLMTHDLLLGRQVKEMRQPANSHAAQVCKLYDMQDNTKSQTQMTDKILPMAGR